MPELSHLAPGQIVPITHVIHLNYILWSCLTCLLYPVLYSIFIMHVSCCVVGGGCVNVGVLMFFAGSRLDTSSFPGRASLLCPTRPSLTPPRATTVSSRETFTTRKHSSSNLPHWAELYKASNKKHERSMARWCFWSLWATLHYTSYVYYDAIIIIPVLRHSMGSILFWWRNPRHCSIRIKQPSVIFCASWMPICQC